MAAYRLSIEAERDIDSTYEYTILNFGPDQARTYLYELEQRFSDLVTNPLLWQAVDHIWPGYRRSVYKKHSIYYRLEDDAVLIIRILGRENPETLSWCYETDGWFQANSKILDIPDMLLCESLWRFWVF